jgi:hypothetical protein
MVHYEVVAIVLHHQEKRKERIKLIHSYLSTILTRETKRFLKANFNFRQKDPRLQRHQQSVAYLIKLI